MYCHTLHLFKIKQKNTNKYLIRKLNLNLTELNNTILKILSLMLNYF